MNTEPNLYNPLDHNPSLNVYWLTTHRTTNDKLELHAHFNTLLYVEPEAKASMWDVFYEFNDGKQLAARPHPLPDGFQGLGDPSLEILRTKQIIQLHQAETARLRVDLERRMVRAARLSDTLRGQQSSSDTRALSGTQTALKREFNKAAFDISMLYAVHKSLVKCVEANEDRHTWTSLEPPVRFSETATEDEKDTWKAVKAMTTLALSATQKELVDTELSALLLTIDAVEGTSEHPRQSSFIWQVHPREGRVDNRYIAQLRELSQGFGVTIERTSGQIDENKWEERTQRMCTAFGNYQGFIANWSRNRELRLISGDSGAIAYSSSHGAEDDTEEDFSPYPNPSGRKSATF